MSPVIERELRVALLRRRAHKQWMATIWGAGVITLAILLLSGFPADRLTGQTLFNLMFVTGSYLAVSRGLRLTADLFSEERRNGTLGLLVLTGLRPIEIFTSKLLGVLLVAAYGLLGGLPFLAVAFLMGGIQFAQFPGALAFITSMLLFCVAIGVFASVLHRDGSQAQMTAILLVVALALGPFAVREVTLMLGTVVSRHWLAFSPAFGAYEILSGFSAVGTSHFWSNIAVTLSYSVCALLAGAIVLHRTWREPVEAVESARRQSRWRAWLAGGKRWRQRLHRELKAGHPIGWRAARNSTPVLAVWVFMWAVLSAWMGGYLIFGAGWLSGGNFLLTSMVLHLGFNWALASAGARWLAEERRSGGFEILLSTPITVGQLIEGQRRALLLQFWSVLRILFSLDLVLCLGGLIIQEWNPQALISHLVTWVLLILFWFGAHLRTAYRAMWIAAWTGRPVYAAAQAGLGIVWPFLLFMLPLWGVWLHDFPTGTTGELIVVGMVLVLLAAGMFQAAGKVREKMERELRDIACAPVPKPDDKRFWGWDPDKIFPPGRWGELFLVPGKKPTRPLEDFRASS
jgi:ABC-type Na+ efflux pump permease subunit